MWKIVVSVILFIGTFIPSIEGQSIRYKRWTVDAGLPSSNVLSITQQGAGYLYFETADGIIRFDGVDFQESKWDRIDEMTMSDTDVLPICSNNGFLYHAAKGKIGKTTLPCPTHDARTIESQNNGWILHHVNGLGESELLSISGSECHKFMFFKNEKGEVDARLVPSGKLPTLPQEEEPLPFQITKSSNGQNPIIHFGDLGLFSFIFESDKINLTPFGGRRGSGFSTAIAGKNEMVWVTGENRIEIHAEVMKPMVYYLPKRLKEADKIVPASKNRIFILDQTGTIYLYDPRTFGFLDITETLHLSNRINDIFADHEGNIWIAEKGEGLYCIYHSQFGSHALGLEDSGVEVNRLLQYENKLWAATSKGVFVLNGYDWSMVSLPGNINAEVFDMGIHPDGRLFFSTDKGVFNFNNNKVENCFQDEKNIHPFLMDEEGYFNFYRQGFLYGYLHCDADPRVWPLADVGNVNAFLQDELHRVWVGTDKGLYLFDTEHISGKRMTIGSDSTHLKIHDIIQIEEHKIALATSRGIWMVSSNLSAYEFEDASQESCHALYVEKGGIYWGVNESGLFKMSKEGEAWSTRFQDAKGYEINDILGFGNNIWLATNKGLVSLEKRFSFDVSLPPLLQYERIFVNGKEREGGHVLKLDYDDQMEFRYSAIAYQNARDLVFRYKLKPNDKWRKTKNRSLVFSNMSAGDYLLDVQAKTPGGDWSDSIRQAFVITPPFWQTYWFYGLLVGLLGLLVYWSVKTIQRRERKRNEINRRFAELELSALQSQMDPHFLFNILNAIQHSILTKDNARANESLNRFAKLMRLFLTSSKQEEMTLAEEVELLDQYCALNQYCYEGDFEYNIEIKDGLDKEEETVPGMIIQPHVENAIRHGLIPRKGDGKLEVIFSRKGKQGLRCIVKDNGVGREESERLKRMSNRDRSSFGMQLTQDRADALRQLYGVHIEIRINDLKGDGEESIGTEVVIDIERED